MFSDRTFRIIFLISLLVHGIIFLYRMNFNSAVNKDKTETLKISYVRVPLKEKLLSQNNKKTRPLPFLKLPLRITAKPVQFEPQSQGKLDSSLIKPALFKPDIAGIKEKISLSLSKTELNKIKDPSYISYSQLSREKIRRALYQNYGDSTVIGIINLAFVVSKDGSLKDVHIIENQSSANPFLRELALKSIQDASPFPPFPADLDYNTELPFNVEISFEK